MNIRWQLKAGSTAVQWLLLATAMLILGGVLGWNLYAERNTVEVREGERLTHNAKVIEDNLVYQLVATNLALDSIRNELRVLKTQKDSKILLNRRLKAMSDAMPGVRTLTILDAEGTLNASSREELIGRNFREREYFQIARRSRDPAMLHVAPPYKTVLGTFTMNLVKVILDERGEFAGAIVATLDPEYFNILLDSVRYAPDMWTSLAHGDGKLFLMVPARPGSEGTDLDKPGSFRNRHLETGQKATVMRGILHATGEECMMAQRIILPASLAMDKPLAVAVARDLKNIFTSWRQKAYAQGSLFVLLFLVSTLGLYFLQKRQRYYNRLVAIRGNERKQAEQALRESEARFRKMFEHNDSVMLLIDPDSGALIDANAAAARFYGYPVERLKSMRIDQINSLTPTEVAEKRLQACHHERNVFIFPHRLASGEVRTVEVRSSPIEVGARSLLFSIVQDITERETATAELKRSNAELEQFSYAISHDMRQPLRMISSYMQLLARELAGRLDDEKREYLNFAKDGAKRLDQMLVGLLEYSRVGRKGEPPTWVESRALLDEALLFLQPAIAEAQANLRIEGDWPRIFVSPDEILRLLQNLIGNALKFRVKGRTPEIIVSSGTVDRTWRISVSDNGVGILPDQIGRLFQVFQRLQSRADYEGTGIGLALCRKIAEHHHGRVWAESAGPGQGSRFWLELPLELPEKKPDFSRPGA